MIDSVRFYPRDWLGTFDPSELFEGERPLAVDIGCGKGRFLLAHAVKHPEVNFLGVDRMLRRIRKIDRKAVRREVLNIRLLRMDAFYTVAYLIPERSVSTYFVFFPDPWPKKKHYDNRLFNDVFLRALHRTLKVDGVLHFSTDHLPYFDEVYALLKADKEFEETETFVPELEETSDFEILFKEKPIGRCSFRHVIV